MLLFDLVNARKAHFSPNSWRVRMALVADSAECLEAAQRIVQFLSTTV